jgi:hypothetical protein
MGIAYGTTTLHQATKGIVQDGLVINIDPSLPESYPGSGTSITDIISGDYGGQQNATKNGTVFKRDRTGGGHFSLDGTDDYILIPGVSYIASNSISHSYCIWVRPRGNGNVISASNQNPQGGWNMPPISVAGGNITGKFWNNTRHTTSGYTNNTWYYVSLVWNYSATASERGQFFYVNGSLVGSQTSITFSGGPSHLFLGQANPGADNAGSLDGDIGPFHLYTNKALTAAEVLQNFNAMKNRFRL